MNILFNIYLILFFTMSYVTQTTTLKRKRNFEIVILDAHCESLTPKIASLECFPSYTKKFSAVNANLMLTQDVYNVSLHVVCTLMRKHQRNFNIVDLQVDVCQFLAYSVKGSVLELFAKEFKEVGVNLEDGCPLRKNIKYGVKELKPDGSFFPPFTPDLNYTIHMDFFFAKERYATFETLGAVYTKKKSKGV